MNGMQAFACISDVDLALIEESMALFEPEAKAGAAVRRRHSGLGQFMSGSWGVALLCAVVSLSVLSAIIWAGRNAPILPPTPGTDETETAAEETEDAKETEDTKETEETEDTKVSETESGTLPFEETDTGESSSEGTDAETEGETEGDTTPETEVERYPDVTEGGLVFISNGDGTCKVKGADKSYQGKLTIPTVSPYGDTVTAVAAGAFRSFRYLTEVEIPDTVTVMGSSAFQGCGSLNSVRLPSAVTEFGKAMFDGCGELRKVDLPAGLTEIPAMTFQTCVSLYSISVQDGITAIGANAFNGCRSLGSLTLPAGLKSIGSQAFLNCCGLGFVYYRGSRAEWEQVNINKTGNAYILNRNVIFID